jgi:hypothetical protein
MKVFIRGYREIAGLSKVFGVGAILNEIPIFPWENVIYLWYIFASIHPFGLPEENLA